MMDPNQNNAYVPPPDPNVNPNPNTPLMDPQYAPPPQQPPTYNAQPQYGQPVANAVPQGGMPNTIVVNQQVPAVMINPNMFKTTPIAITCTFCNKPITTTVTQKFNCCACCLCWFTGLIWYVCIQLCRGKDICCYDASHTCPYCGNVGGTYTAC